jgi:hypothetical protein
MPAEPTIVCPNCQSKIKLTESLAAPLLEATREQYERRLAARDAEIRKAVTAEEVGKARALVGDELEARTREIAELEERDRVQREKLARAQEAQAEFMRKERALEEKERELNLTIEQRVQDEAVLLREQVRREIADDMKFKLSEKDLTLEAMKKQLEEMKRRMEQGSQQMQGELLELELESLLGSRFPHDAVVPVPKGEFGGDVLQRVCGPNGLDCGTILWESKRTKNWSDTWLPKLKKDQREAKAEVSVLVSATLPKGVDGFGEVDSVWVASPRFALPLAALLRSTLVELASLKIAGQGLQTKTELVYAYLTGPRFRQRVQAMSEAFTAMEADLRAEKKTILKQWAKREAQIDRVVQATVGMYGDLQGIAGRTLPEIEGLVLPEPESAN